MYTNSNQHAVPVALTIAGSDSSGGAGIQADLKTFSALQVYGASVITAVTAQNTQGIYAIHSIPAAIISAQLRAVLQDLDVKSIKIGMLGEASAVDAVADILDEFCSAAVVIDPVMLSKSGKALLHPDALLLMKKRLFPLATVFTPNLPEAAALTGFSEPTCLSEMYQMLGPLHELGVPWVLLKGGHLPAEEQAIDLLSDGERVFEFKADRIVTKNTHGTGCTLSSAVAAGLAKGMDVEQSVREAKKYISVAIAAADSLLVGAGHGPLHHFSLLWSQKG
ncbi:bifunctional hydroxymethylpyrimidine kinase/phosphomethylpyrimidine kinase [Neptunomonas qingdaonensis]|uniref:hydroxymethylpyrimidine kinase n=1 Tax=Neptunomonas qingdaonensis TaxID=1045558 RepID=A0A1I2WDY1_9GAMM|nr:bifunctional hydroxymethylpyrimidine kinase/phosphomethylpyrimidine kinase [Neptunomonas qingdaonensis]SFG99533.1 hydroxymethylpyrimidine/phosphomethylpyrimidine kinase [Neptunomonas qingdaonensis]